MGGGPSKQETIKEKAREWQRQIRSENRRLDRDIQKIRQEEQKLKKEITAMAAKGQAASVKTLARQVVRSRKAATRLGRTKASMSSVSLHLTTAIAQMSTSTSLKMSAGVMKEMNKLMSMPELQKTMDEMRTEMARADIADEMIEEAFEESDDEGEIDQEVAKVFDEVGLDMGQFMATTGVGEAPLPVATAPAPAAAPDPLMDRLAALQK